MLGSNLVEVIAELIKFTGKDRLADITSKTYHRMQVVDRKQCCCQQLLRNYQVPQVGAGKIFTAVAGAGMIYRLLIPCILSVYDIQTIPKAGHGSIVTG